MYLGKQAGRYKHMVCTAIKVEIIFNMDYFEMFR